MVSDATNIFFHAPEIEDICGECLEEFLQHRREQGLDDDVVFKFLKKVYGRRDGPLGFFNFVADVLAAEGMGRCEALRFSSGTRPCTSK